MTKREEHIKLLKDLEEKYLKSDKQYYEFVWDGPSNWELYENSFPKILFLVKEARNGYHPSTPLQKANTKFMRNIARWSLIIDKAFEQVELPTMPSNSDLREFNDSVAIMEVKKINQENISSTSKDLNEFAFEDREFLKRQIKIIGPQVIFCAGTLDCFDIIHDHKYEFHQKLFSIANTNVWLVDRRIIIGFKHPSIFGWADPNKKDNEAFENLKDLLSNDLVKNAIQQIIANSTAGNIGIAASGA